jgi:hypothetical protein
LDRLKREIANALHGVWQIPTILPLTTTMPSDRKQVVVLYAETKLQKSIDLPGSATAANAKEEAMVAIRDHLIHMLPGVPPISLDPDCTDFYPGTSLLPMYS